MNGGSSGSSQPWLTCHCVDEERAGRRACDPPLALAVEYPSRKPTPNHRLAGSTPESELTFIPPTMNELPRKPLPRGHAAPRDAIFALVLFCSLPRGATAAESSAHYKFQHYQESNDRIRVDSHYAMAEVDFNAVTRLRARGVIDTITGMTPTGAPAPTGSDEVPLAELEDERHAFVADASHVFGATTGRLELAYSDEDDYLSRGYAATVLHDLNQKNTQLQVGFSYVDDAIRFGATRPKLSRDFMVGVTQLLDRNTTLTCNLTWGRARGYLSDPYKLVQKAIEIAPGFPLDLTFPENRPDERTKRIAYVQLLHLFENTRGTADVSYRYLEDDQGLESDTIELAWLQRFGANWIVQPFYRYYAQNAADYYIYDLDNTPIVPVANPTSAGPFYSSDYRLSKFDATTAGLKLVYRVDDQWSVDLTYERYDMHGRDGVTPQSAYATANIFSIGGRLWF